MVRQALRCLWVMSLALAALPLHAHDVWIVPSSFAPAVGQVVGLRLLVGQDLRGEALALVPGLARQFVVQDAVVRRPLAPRLRTATAALLRVTAPGLQVVGYYSHPSFIELPADKFNAYLAEEGLEAILAQRAGLDQSLASGREMYTRCAKTLLRTAPIAPIAPIAPTAATTPTQADQRLGFPLELVAERNPYDSVAGQALPVRLSFEDRPLAGALVVAINSRDGSHKLSARTDNDGRVQLLLPAGGLWLVKAVHMVPAPAGAAADWASYWASLTFETEEPGALRR